MDGMRQGPATRIEAVVEAIQRKIAARSLVSGAKLPSIRAFARQMQVSPTTVVEAYDRLAAAGVIRSRPGSGFFVAGGAAAPLSLADVGPRLDRAVDPLWVSRQSLDAGETALRPGCGWLPPDWMPEASLARALRAVSRRGGSTLTDYGTPLGHPPLRALVARPLAERGIDAGADRILLVESGTSALDLVFRLLLEPGDRVIVDDPCYFNFHALLRAHRAVAVPVPMTPAGPDVEAFAAAVREHAPRLYVTNAAVHNPTGAVLSPATAHRVLRIAADAGLTVLEDDIFADFESAPAPRLATLDGLERVVSVGSFSKTLSASLRCGWIAAPEAFLEPLADLRVATGFGSPRLAAEVVHAALSDGGYRKHLDGLHVRLARARETVARRLSGYGITPWIEPDAGMFLWCRLPDGADAADLARRALAEDLVLAPGNVFSAAGTAAGFMRFNVAQMGDERVWRVLGRCLSRAVSP